MQTIPKCPTIILKSKITLVGVNQTKKYFHYLYQNNIFSSIRIGQKIWRKEKSNT